MNLLGMQIPCWLIPLIVGVICALLGYLLGRLFGNSNKEEINILENKINELETALKACNTDKLSLQTSLDSKEADLKSFNSDKLNLQASLASTKTDLKTFNDDKLSLQTNLASVEAALEACRNDKLNLETSLASMKTDLEVCNADKLNIQSSLKDAEAKNLNIASSLTAAAAPATNLIPFNSALAKVIFGKKIKQDDLKIVEGIGPKIEGLFHNFGIKTWKALGETSVEKCQEVLNSGGERYRIHKPTTWPKQAELAYKGEWKELLKWQDELDGGK